jgi:hypothetical protein
MRRDKEQDYFGMLLPKVTFFLKKVVNCHVHSSAGRKTGGSGRYGYSGASHGQLVRQAREAASAPRAQPVPRRCHCGEGFTGELKLK